MYSLTDIRQAIRDPRLISREANRLYHARFHTRPHNTAGTDVFAEDWDNLLILDACRYDVFADVAPSFDLPGELQHRISRGSSTAEFIRANLHGKSLTDTVYVSATTMLYREGNLNERVDLDLHDIVDVWEDSIDHGEFGVRPETMAQRALVVQEEYPNKRLVVHFIQPHIPFIGEVGRKHLGEIGEDVWRAKRRGNLDVSDETLRTAYRENLELVLSHVKDLLKELGGRTVVSADHGQLIGDRNLPLPIKDYGHPSGYYSDELVKVPWHVSENGSRREIIDSDGASEYGQKRTEEIDEKAKEHLAHLGYVE